MSEMQTSKKQSCVGCLGQTLYEFFNASNSPVNCGSISRDRDEAMAAQTGDIKLVYCLDCGLVHNRAFDVSKIDFKPGYEVALTHSKTFLDFQTSVVERLTQSYDLKQKDILEIGCGDGSFLKRLCQSGSNRGVGIDPTVPEAGSFDLPRGSVRFIRDFFDDTYADEIRDFVCSLSMFEDIPQPLEFLLMLRKMIGERKPNIYFEVFNGFRSIEVGEIWSVHYEQCNYLSLPVLEDLFRRAGFEITSSGPCYENGQYLFVEAVPAKLAKSDSSTASVANHEPPAVVRHFADSYRQRIGYWLRKLDELNRNNCRAVLWGSGGKGISFLNAIKPQNQIQFVVDINPNRQGSHIPGTAQEIIAPEQLVGFRPDLIVLTNPIYESEIRNQVAELNIECDFDII